MQFEIGGKNGALNGLHQVKFTDNDDQRILLIDDVFYNTSENRYGVWYHYEGDMDEDGNANTDWVNVYDLFTWATPVKQAPQTETQSPTSKRSVWQTWQETRHSSKASKLKV